MRSAIAKGTVFFRIQFAENVVTCLMSNREVTASEQSLHLQSCVNYNVAVVQTLGQGIPVRKGQFKFNLCEGGKA